MDNLPVIPPRKNYEIANKLALSLAAEELAGLDDIKEQCHLSVSEYHRNSSGEYVIISYLNRPYRMNLPDAEISPIDGEGTIALRDKLLIVHYFLKARGTPLANRVITFRELPDGIVYYPTHMKRTSLPIAEHFGRAPELLLDAAGPFGGYRADYGDIAVTINAFPRVPVTIVLWRGDADFPPSANVLLDASIPDYLPTEDITVICEIITWKLVGKLGKR